MSKVSGQRETRRACLGWDFSCTHGLWLPISPTKSRQIPLGEKKRRKKQPHTKLFDVKRSRADASVKCCMLFGRLIFSRNGNLVPLTAKLFYFFLFFFLFTASPMAQKKKKKKGGAGPGAAAGDWLERGSLGIRPSLLLCSGAAGEGGGNDERRRKCRATAVTGNHTNLRWEGEAPYERTTSVGKYLGR